MSIKELNSEEKLQEMVDALQLRKLSAPKPVDNASLPAGSSMTYYCRQCRHISDVRGELNFGPVQRYCPECQKMLDQGWNNDQQRFIPFEWKTCGKCGGSGTEVIHTTSFFTPVIRRFRCDRCNGEGRYKVTKDGT